jgi:hypothetical protein
MRTRLLTTILFVLFALQGAVAQQPYSTTTPDVSQALASISADSLRGHLSFIASDLLEGRATPSRGLDIAAEYIAAQFRRVGLEPVGDDAYFQTANWESNETPADAFLLRIRNGAETVSLSARQVSALSEAALKLDGATIIKVSAEDLAEPAKIAGKVVLLDAGPGQASELARRIQAMNPALALIVDRNSSAGRGLPPARLIDPERPSNRPTVGASVVVLHDKAIGALFDSLPSGESAARLDFVMPERISRPVKLKNVIGLLRGSDPVLKDTYVLVTAHYDHVGVRPGMEGDNIFNGANDDGSGTVSVIEIASALSKLKVRPKRSLVFMTVFGEERGLLGSRYYGRHPIFPLVKTIADLNLEQVGRTDSTEGSQVNRASMTGFDFSDIGPTFMKAGELTGVEVYKHEKNSDSFFGRSDNQALADAGVPAHTLCVAFEYPDYHREGDHWEKVDYVNLARTDRTVALGLWMMASADSVPKWNESNPKTARYVEAWKKLQGQ